MAKIRDDAQRIQTVREYARKEKGKKRWDYVHSDMSDHQILHAVGQSKTPTATIDQMKGWLRHNKRLWQTNGKHDGEVLLVHLDEAGESLHFAGPFQAKEAARAYADSHFSGEQWLTLKTGP